MSPQNYFKVSGYGSKKPGYPKFSVRYLNKKDKIQGFFLTRYPIYDSLKINILIRENSLFNKSFFRFLFFYQKILKIIFTTNSCIK